MLPMHQAVLDPCPSGCEHPSPTGGRGGLHIPSREIQRHRVVRDVTIVAGAEVETISLRHQQAFQRHVECFPQSAAWVAIRPESRGTLTSTKSPQGRVESGRAKLVFLCLLATQ